MDKNALKSAIGRRRGQGLNLHIMIGGDEADSDNQMKDLAPEVNDVSKGLGAETSDIETQAAQMPVGPDSMQDMLGEAGSQLPMANKLAKAAKDKRGQKLS